MIEHGKCFLPLQRQRGLNPTITKPESYHWCPSEAIDHECPKNSCSERLKISMKTAVKVPGLNSKEGLHSRYFLSHKNCFLEELPIVVSGSSNIFIDTRDTNSHSFFYCLYS